MMQTLSKMMRLCIVRLYLYDADEDYYFTYRFVQLYQIFKIE
jgi:hypothetical protein